MAINQTKALLSKLVDASKDSRGALDMIRAFGAVDSIPQKSIVCFHFVFVYLTLLLCLLIILAVLVKDA
jgi:hypothetical protein